MKANLIFDNEAERNEIIISSIACNRKTQLANWPLTVL